MCNGYATFAASRDVVDVVAALRSQIEAILQRKIDSPAMNIGEAGRGLVDATVKLLSTEEADFGSGSYGRGGYGTGGGWGGGGGGEKRFDDWVCPGCQASCFGSKAACFQCGTLWDAAGDGGDARGLDGWGEGVDGAYEGRGGRGGRAGDWNCPSCNALVFGR